MDSIKSKMKSLSEATQEATHRANAYEEETMRVNEIAEKFEEQVSKKGSVVTGKKCCSICCCSGPKHSKENAVPRGSV